MPSIFPVPLSSIHGVGQAQSTERPLATLLLQGVSLESQRGNRIEALIRHFGAHATKPPELLFPGKSPIELDPAVAQLFVPMSNGVSKAQFQILRQHPDGSLELALLKLIGVSTQEDAPPVSANAPKGTTTGEQAQLSNASKALHQALIQGGDTAPSLQSPSNLMAPQTPAMDSLPLLAKILQQEGSISQQKPIITLLTNPANQGDLSSSSTQSTLLSNVAHPTALQVALVLSQLKNIPHALGIGYERALAQWTEFGASHQGAQQIKEQFPQAQKHPLYIQTTQDAFGQQLVQPSNNSISVQVLAHEQKSIQWSGALLPNISMTMHLTQQKPDSWPQAFEQDDAPQKKGGASKTAHYLRLYVEFERLGGIYIWGLAAESNQTFWIRAQTAQTARLLEEQIPLYTQSLPDFNSIIKLVKLDSEETQNA